MHVYTICVYSVTRVYGLCVTQGSWSTALANLALHMVKSERITGYRRTESVVRRGMAFEGAGELLIAHDGALTLRKPTVRSMACHECSYPLFQFCALQKPSTVL